MGVLDVAVTFVEHSATSVSQYMGNDCLFMGTRPVSKGQNQHLFCHTHHCRKSPHVNTRKQAVCVRMKDQNT